MVEDVEDDGSSEDAEEDWPTVVTGALLLLPPPLLNSLPKSAAMVVAGGCSELTITGELEAELLETVVSEGAMVVVVVAILELSAKAEELLLPTTSNGFRVVSGRAAETGEMVVVTTTATTGSESGVFAVVTTSFRTPSADSEVDEDEGGDGLVASGFTVIASRSYSRVVIAGEATLLPLAVVVVVVVIGGTSAGEGSAAAAEVPGT